MKHAVRIVVVAWIVGTLGALCGTAHGEVRPGWYVGMSHGVIRVVDPGSKQELVGTDSGTDLALSSDGSILVAVTEDQLGIVDARTMASRTQRWVEGKRSSHVALSPVGTHAAISTRNGAIAFYDFAHDEFLSTVDLGEISIRDVAYSPDGRYVYATTAMIDPSPPPSGAVVIIDALARQIVDRIELAPNARRMAISADGTIAYVAAGLSLWKVDLVQRRIERSWYLAAPVTDVTLSLDEQRAYAVFGNSDSASLGTIDVNREDLVSTRQLAGCSVPNRIELAADGRSLAITLQNFSALIFVDIETGEVSALALNAVPWGVVPFDLSGITSQQFTPLRSIAADELFTCSTAIAIDNVTGAPGETVDIAVRIESEPGIDIAGIQNDIIFDPRVLARVEGHGCRIDPAIGFSQACDDDPRSGPCKKLHSNVRPCAEDGNCPEGLEDWDAIRVLLLSLMNVNPFPPGVAYSCRFKIRDDAVPQTTTALRCKESGAADPHGDGLPIICRDGSISITVADTPTPSPTPTSSVPPINLPLDPVDSRVTTVDAGGCQTTPAPHPIGLLLLLPPLATVILRRKAWQAS